MKWRTATHYILSFLEGRSAPFVTALALACTGVIAALDYLVGPAVSLAMLYLIPIFIAAWYADAVVAFGIAVVSALTWLVAEPGGAGANTGALIPFWNALVHLALFALLLSFLLVFRDRVRMEPFRARTDALTGLLNASGLKEKLADEVERSRRYERPLSIAYIDLDDFGSVNAAYSRAAGDIVLRRVAVTMQQYTRSSDIVARQQTDEFVIGLVESGGTAAVEAVRELSGRLEACLAEMRCPVTFSIGLVSYEQPPEEVESMIRAAAAQCRENRGRGETARAETAA